MSASARGDLVQTLHTAADGLTGHGFDVAIPGQEQRGELRLTNVRGAVCTVELTDRATVGMLYRPLRGAATSPGLIMAIVLGILAVPTDGQVAVRHYPALGLKGVVGRNLTEHGMDVRLTVIYRDEVNTRFTPRSRSPTQITPGAGASGWMTTALSSGNAHWLGPLRGMTAWHSIRSCRRSPLPWRGTAHDSFAGQLRHDIWHPSRQH